MTNRTKAALLGAGAMLSAAALGDGIARVIDRNMVGEALDRAEPKTMLRLKTKIKGFDDTRELEESLDRLGRKLSGMPHETLEIRSFDGTKLVGHLYPAENPKRVIVAMHGWRSSWCRDFSIISDFLRRNGCTVLYAEQRGQGGSDGTHMGFGMIERFDCLEWVKHLNARGFADSPIYLAGLSMGAATVLMASGLPDLPANVKGVLADCGFTSAKAEWKHISENNLHMPYALHARYVDALCRRRIDLVSDAYSTLDAMRTNVTPILFIHGAADTFVPVEMTLQAYEACRAPKKLLIVEGANHGMSYLMDREAYEKAVLEFWEEQETHGASTNIDI